MLRHKAYLEISLDNDTAVFQFSDGFEPTRTGERSFLMAARGQYLTSVFDQVVEGETIEAENMAGYHLDGGAGQRTISASFETGGEDEPIEWGDGSGGDGPDNVTQTDASGANVNKFDRMDIFEHVMASARTDSVTPAYLHHNQWSDGTYGATGVYGGPMAVTVDGWNISTELSDPATLEGTITMTRLQVLPAVASDGIQAALDDISDFG